LTEEELLELVQIQEALNQRVSSNPLKYFWPHQRNCDGENCSKAHIEFETFDGRKHVIRGCPQAEFLNTCSDTTAYFGGNRSGKTTAGAVKVAMLTTGQYPDWYSGRRWDRQTVGRVFAQDFAKGVKVVTKSLREWLPKDSLVAVKKNNQGAEVEWYIKHVDGTTSFFDIMTHEQSSDVAEGWHGDWAWFDEPPPRSLWISTVRGLVDNDGIDFFTLTPLKEPWLFDEIYNSKNNRITSILCDLRHNLERINPYTKQYVGLKEDSIRKFESKLTEEERETRMHGKFRYLAGRIWKEWEREIHTYDRSFWMEGRDSVVVDGQPPEHWPRFMLIDPHDRNPHALLWVAVDETDNYWAYREAWLADAIIEDVVAHIKAVELANRERVQMRIMDPNFGPKRYANRGYTVRDEFEQSGKKLNYPIRFSFGDDRKEVGRKAFASLLKFDPLKPVSLLNHPKFRVASDMKEFIYQIEHYVWDEYRSNIDRDPKEKPKDLNTHFPDLCHYMSLSNFKSRKPPRIIQGVGNYYT
jgi:phage terminase large subunit-like protein